MKTTRKLLAILMAVGLCFGLTGMAMAGSTDTTSVSIIVQAIDEIAATGTPTLTINAGTATGFTAGDSLFTVTDAASCTYGVTTNSASNKKITAHLDTAITETAVNLYITLASASGISAGGRFRPGDHLQGNCRGNGTDWYCCQNSYIDPY